MAKAIKNIKMTVVYFNFIVFCFKLVTEIIRLLKIILILLAANMLVIVVLNQNYITPLLMYSIQDWIRD